MNTQPHALVTVEADTCLILEVGSEENLNPPSGPLERRACLFFAWRSPLEFLPDGGVVEEREQQCIDLFDVGVERGDQCRERWWCFLGQFD